MYRGPSLHLKPDVGAIGFRMVVGPDQTHLRCQVALLGERVFQVLRRVVQGLEFVAFAGPDCRVAQPRQGRVKHAAELGGLLRRRANDIYVAELCAPVQRDVEDDVRQPVLPICLHLGAYLGQEIAGSLEEGLQLCLCTLHVVLGVRSPWRIVRDLE